MSWANIRRLRDSCYVQRDGRSVSVRVHSRRHSIYSIRIIPKIKRRRAAAGGFACKNGEHEFVQLPPRYRAFKHLIMYVVYARCGKSESCPIVYVYKTPRRDCQRREIRRRGNRCQSAGNRGVEPVPYPDVCRRRDVARSVR